MPPLEERKGHLKVILSPSSCARDLKIKRQTRNDYSMHVFLKSFYLSIVFAALEECFISVSARTGGRDY